MHRESDGTYGVPGITAELRDEGERVNHKRGALVMRQAGLRVCACAAGTAPRWRTRPRRRPRT
ncbi:IS3 family transposase [Streptomyces achromogenes]|uniref:IS3 family transposase n=1 Tax=Streptomyces achromogenes TaxID=67255 RepID=UPI0036F6A7CC